MEIHSSWGTTSDKDKANLDQDDLDKADCLGP
jgi:hypothetical protein